MSAQAPPMVLSYADLPARWGVSIIRDERGLRIVVPPVPSWRLLHKGFFIGGAVLAMIVAFMLAVAILAHDPTIIPAACIYATGLAAIFLVAFYRLHRRIIFDVTPGEVVVTVFSPLFSRSRRAWPRGSIAEIKRNPGNGKLLLRVTGKELVEIYISPNNELTQWLAETLNAELQSAPTTTPMRHIPVTASMSPKARRILLAILSTTSLIGLAMCFMGPFGVAIGALLLCASAIAAGISLGTQDKEFFF